MLFTDPHLFHQHLQLKCKKGYQSQSILVYLANANNCLESNLCYNISGVLYRA